MHVWSVIGHLVITGILPPPMSVDTSNNLDIKLRFKSEVDQWVQFLGMPPAKCILGTQSYGSIDFRNGKGWLGLNTIHVYTLDGT